MSAVPDDTINNPNTTFDKYKGGKNETLIGNNQDKDIHDQEKLYREHTVKNDMNTISTARGIINTKIERINDLNIESFPESYKKNSSKEQLCLEYVENFCTQFQDVFNHRSKLFICPLNEFSISKFVCTTIRPTLVPYRNLYDAKPCSEFVSNIIEYEPLVDPIQPPKYLPSTKTVLEWQKGDCFDMSTLLVSFLIGSGYDAFVVHGYAPKYICLLDQTKMTHPFSSKQEEDPKSETLEDTPAQAEAKENDIDSRFQSKYMKMVEVEEESKRLASTIIPNYEDDEEDDEEEEDSSIDKRTHSWVLLRAGKRNVDNHLFIEPTTGQFYSIDNSPYEGIEAIWNNQNYYVNMQTASIVKEIRFDISKSSDWEYVFIVKGTNPKLTNNEDDDSVGELNSENEAFPIANDGASDTVDNEVKDENEIHENILDLPTTWVKPLLFDHEVYQLKYTKSGESTIMFHKSKLEKYAEYVHDQGLVERFTMYQNISRTVPLSIHERYKNRKDHLKERVHYPLEFKIIEYFNPGRLPDALECRIEYFGESRELHFYKGARIDGLIRRKEIFLKKNIEYFEGRDDLLTYRSVNFSSDLDELKNKKTLYTLSSGIQGDLIIHKMTEKFSNGSSLLGNNETPRKRTYFVTNGTIRVNCHYKANEITAPYYLFYKNDLISGLDSEQADQESSSTSNKIEVISNDPNFKKPQERILNIKFNEVMQSEKNCFSMIRDSEFEMEELMKFRRLEESSIVLEKNIFDAAKENACEDKLKEEKKEEENEDDLKQSDYLTPYLPHSGELSKDEAQRTRDLCLKSLKERLLERANIIQTRLEEENSELAKRQAAFQRSQHDQEQTKDEKFEQFCSDAMFRISILEQRLTRHEESALQKYADLDHKLQNDVRLSKLR